MNRHEWTFEQIQVTYPKAQVLGEVLKQMEAQLRSQGQLICRFQVNGVVFTEDDEEKFASTPLKEVTNLIVDTDSPMALLAGVITNWTEQLPHLVERSDELSEKVKFQGLEGHFKDFVELIDTVQLLVDSLVSLQQLFPCEIYQSPLWQSNEAATSQAIAEAVVALEKKDFVILAEILEYDFGNALQTWFQLLEGLKSLLHDKQDSYADSFNQRIIGVKGPSGN